MNLCGAYWTVPHPCYLHWICLVASLGSCGTGETPLPVVVLCSASSSPSLAEGQLLLLPNRLFLSQSPQLLKTDHLSKMSTHFPSQKNINGGFSQETNLPLPNRGRSNIVLHCFPLSVIKRQGKKLWELFLSPPAFLSRKYRDILERNAINLQVEENSSCELWHLQLLESNGSFCNVTFPTQLHPVSRWYKKKCITASASVARLKKC